MMKVPPLTRTPVPPESQKPLVVSCPLIAPLLMMRVPVWLTSTPRLREPILVGIVIRVIVGPSKVRVPLTVKTG